MKPKKLTMKAFGSYADETVIDFDRIGNKLYLISGETSAGKTIIFDAITYALFGGASGKYRKPENFHSHYVGYDVPTEVTLEYEHGGKTHKVTRTIRYRRKHGAGDEQGRPVYDTTPLQEADFFEEGRAPIKGSTAVTRRISEQLGMDIEQFRKIVMLAQGEFRKFLDSDDTDRAKILDRLFDFGKYADFQNRIKFATQKLEAETKEQSSAKKMLMEALQLPEDMNDEEKAVYSPDHPRLIEALTELVNDDDEKLKAAGQAKEEAEANVAKLSEKEKEASLFNKKLTELELAKEHQGKLDEQQKEQEASEKQLARAEKAVREVLPKEKEYQKRKRDLEELDEKLRISTSEQEKAKLLMENAGKEKNRAHTECDGRIEQLTHEIDQIDKAMPRYNEQEKDITELTGREKSLTQIEKNERDARNTQEDNRNKLEDAGKKLEALKGAETDLLNAETELDTAEKECERITGKGGIADRVETLRKSKDAEAEKKKELVTAAQKRQACWDRYDELEHAFWSQQVKRLALDLESEIKENGSGVCKVCGTKHQQIPVFEKQYNDNGRLISEEELKQAKEAYEAENTKFNEQDKAYSALQAKNETECDNLVKEANAVFGDSADWETLSSEAYMSGKKSLMQTLLKEKKEKRAACSKRVEERKALEKEVRELEQAQVDLQKKLELLTKDKAEAEKTIAMLQATIEERKKGFPYPTLEEAGKKTKEFRAELKKLQDRINEADQMAEKANTALAAADGSLKTINEQLPTAEEAEKKANALYTEAVSDAGFSDEADYHAALPEEGEQWIRETVAAINAYKTDLRDTRNKIEALSKECEGRVIEDLEALRIEKENAESVKKEAEAKYLKCHTTRQNHRTTLDKIEDIRNKNEVAEEALKKLKSLNSVASGANSEAGKLSFQRYVMGETFREMLDAANKRLNDMTKGRYEFLHSTEGRNRNTVAGLGIELMDHQTGKVRPCGEICGGESFQMSMALALGLSDIVQRHAGGQTIDSMFIDEGFGSLSEGALEDVVKCLTDLAGDSRQIGIISHVAMLEECVSPKILVERTDNGSKLEYRE